MKSLVSCLFSYEALIVAILVAVALLLFVAFPPAAVACPPQALNLGVCQQQYYAPQQIVVQPQVQYYRQIIQPQVQYYSAPQAVVQSYAYPLRQNVIVQRQHVRQQVVVQKVRQPVIQRQVIRQRVVVPRQKVVVQQQIHY